jgi:hypothetical protein
MRAMAEPDGTAEVQGTVAVRGSVAKKDPDAIVAEIERTRENLAQTIDELADKVSPANNVRRLKERLAEQAARPDVQLAAAAVGLAVLGFTIYRIWGRRRR